MVKVVYICWNSISEPLVDSQVLSYLKELTKKGFEFTLVTVEGKSVKASESDYFKNTDSFGINWQPVYKSSFGSLFTIFNVARMVKRLCKIDTVQLIHSRSFFSTYVAYLVKKQIGIPYIYDIRGFWVDEKVFKGTLKQGGLLFKYLKKLDLKLYNKADGIVSLTQSAKSIIKDQYLQLSKNSTPIEVIPTCVNHELFHYEESDKSSINLVYLGSIGNGYLGEVIFKIFAIAQDNFPELNIILISRSSEKLMAELSFKFGLDLNNITHLRLNHSEVPKALCQSGIGLSFIEPHFSKKASCATKIGEYLASGMPVLCNKGIGDMDEVLSEANVATFCDQYDNESLKIALKNAIEKFKENGIQDRCVKLAQNYFSLQNGVQRYESLYTTIVSMD